jgi:16S rRNA G1207 methylase RsmC
MAKQLTNRPNDDFYVTPEYCTEAIIPHLKKPKILLEPACGDGAMTKIFKKHWPDVKIYGFELNQERAKLADIELLGDNFLTKESLEIGKKLAPDLIITNPPFKHALEFVQQSLKMVAPDGKVIMLLRLNWLGSQKRAEFLKHNTPSVYVLPKRPRFTGNGDSCEYGWLSFSNQIPTVKILEISE